MFILHSSNPLHMWLSWMCGLTMVWDTGASQSIIFVQCSRLWFKLAIFHPLRSLISSSGLTQDSDPGNNYCDCYDNQEEVLTIVAVDRAGTNLMSRDWLSQFKVKFCQI